MTNVDGSFDAPNDVAWVFGLVGFVGNRWELLGCQSVLGIRFGLFRDVLLRIESSSSSKEEEGKGRWDVNRQERVISQGMHQQQASQEIKTDGVINRRLQAASHVSWVCHDALGMKCYVILFYFNF